jgi:hypothetical protein
MMGWHLNISISDLLNETFCWHKLAANTEPCKPIASLIDEFYRLIMSASGFADSHASR